MTAVAKWRARALTLTHRRAWGVVTVPSATIDPLGEMVTPRTGWLRDSQFTVIADPFLAEQGGRRWMLAETKRTPSEPGTIGAWELSGNEAEYRGTAIAEPGIHLSYPFVLSWNGALFAVPERAQGGAPRLYVADALPCGWRRAAAQFPNRRLLDPTIFEHGGRWWLFATDRDAGRYSLFAWHAESPLGPWRSHGLAPLKNDAGSSRPAGTPIRHGGRLYRPAQDGRHGYGGGLVFNEITELTPETFRERIAGAVRPNPAAPYPDGVHHISVLGETAVLDGLAVRASAAAAADVFASWWRRRAGEKRCAE